MSLDLFSLEVCATGTRCQQCRHRINGRGFRLEMRGKYRLPQLDFECPEGRAWVEYVEPNSLVPARTVPNQKPGVTVPHPGSSLWSQLHSLPMSPADFVAWLNQVAQLPGCSCKTHTAEALAKLPPRFIDGILDWWWTWEFHEEINRLLGKVGMGREEAAANYGWQVAARRGIAVGKLVESA